jgi:hypothetical protein
MLKNNKNHKSDSLNWTMIEFMHQWVMRATKAIVGVASYVALSCDRVFTIDNQF